MFITLTYLTPKKERKKTTTQIKMKNYYFRKQFNHAIFKIFFLLLKIRNRHRNNFVDKDFFNKLS